MDEWSWLETVDPESVERERFNVDAAHLKRTEGTQLGFITVAPSREERAAMRRAEAEHQAVLRRGHMWSRVRSLELELARERRAREKEAEWHRRVLEIRGRADVRPFVGEKGIA